MLTRSRRRVAVGPSAHIDRVVALLLDKETINAAELLAIVGDGSTLQPMLAPPAPTA
jgi:hypothetical protein